VITYNTILSGYVRQGIRYTDPRIATLLQHMQRYKVACNVITYSSLLQSIGKSREAPDIASKIFTSMQIAGIHPDLKAWTIFITIWCESLHIDREEQVMQLLQSMKELGHSPNGVTYTAMLSMWARSSRHDAADQVKHILQQMRSQKIPLDSIVYSSLLSILAKTNPPDAPSRALDILQSIRTTTKLKPNIFHWSTVLSIWANADMEGKEEVVQNLFDK
jgi:hypothetical protein